MNSMVSYSLHDVEFFDTHIHTTVTACAEVVDDWIDTTLHINRRKLCKLLVGLDTEWCLDEHQTVAIIQLCVGRRCLIFQLCHAAIPQSLVDFLATKKFTFVGKEVKNDARKLLENYDLRVSRVEDVSHMAAAKYHDKDYKRVGLKALVFEFLHRVMKKPKHIIISRWDSFDLTYDQIEYACIDAYVSYKLAEELKKPRVF